MRTAPFALFNMQKMEDYVCKGCREARTNIGSRNVEGDCLVITPTGMTVPRVHEPSQSGH
jgi:hypothetical protein